MRVHLYKITASQIIKRSYYKNCSFIYIIRLSFFGARTRWAPLCTPHKFSNLVRIYLSVAFLHALPVPFDQSLYLVI
jgi:hypothetical protein